MKKKKIKLKKKNVYIFLFIVLVLLVVIFYNPAINIFSLMRKGYTFSESSNLYYNDLAKKALEKDYSNTIAKISGNKEFVNNNFDIYCEIEYYDNKDFLLNVNRLIDKGYNSNDINNINYKNDTDLTDYLVNNYVDNISKWIEYDFFKTENIERYLKNFDGDYKNTIVQVNIGLDKPYYEDVNIIEEYSSTVLANKYNKLDSNFVPDDITLLDKCSEGKAYLSKEAKEAYDNLCMASIDAGLSLSVNSAYRSYEDQQEIYDTYYSLYGQSYVDKYVARPGYSEHQTGLALDVKSKNSNLFINSKEYSWMLDNAYKYGFVLRYPKDKEDITGYDFEAWHFRYVGVDIAKYIYENNITYDEYYVMFLDIN